MNSSFLHQVRSQREWKRCAVSAAVLAVALFAISAERCDEACRLTEESWNRSSLATRVVVAMTAAAREWSRVSTGSSFDVLLAGEPFRMSGVERECIDIRAERPPEEASVRIDERLLAIPPPLMG